MRSNGTSGVWRYEYTVVLVQWFIWGFVALDRNVITYLFPLIIPELKMDFTQVGLTMSALGAAWAIGSLLCGGLSDKYGRKTIIIPATIIFSVLSWLTGVVGSVGQLIAVRAIMGLPEGSYFPAAAATIAEESAPSRRGLMLGIHQSGWAVTGMLLGPIYATAVASVWGWRWAFFMTLIPGLIITLFYWRLIHEPASTAARIKARREGVADQVQSETSEPVDWKKVFGYRNIIICSIATIAIMSWLFNFLSFGTLFVTEFRKVELLSAGFVMAAFGLGGLIGYIVVNALSDQIGRKICGVGSCLLCAVASFAMTYVGGDPFGLAVSIFFMGVFGLGVFTLFSVVASESVPFAFAGLAIGFPGFIGEIFGAAVMPIIGGAIADAYGLQAAMLVASTSALVAMVLLFGIKETAPKVIAKKAVAAPLA